MRPPRGFLQRLGIKPFLKIFFGGGFQTRLGNGIDTGIGFEPFVCDAAFQFFPEGLFHPLVGVFPGEIFEVFESFVADFSLARYDVSVAEYFHIGFEQAVVILLYNTGCDVVEILDSVFEGVEGPGGIIPVVCYFQDDASGEEAEPYAEEALVLEYFIHEVGELFACFCHLDGESLGNCRDPELFAQFGILFMDEGVPAFLEQGVDIIVRQMS